MLSRPSTKITLTVDDIAAYEQRKMIRDMARHQEFHSSQEGDESDQSTIENGDSTGDADTSPTAATRPGTRAMREQRMGVGGGTRG
ncbi:hypothetical protein K431DRAFT_288561 [Polychaeton citri CBS 116435]|uniref:Uncharacterized protein n=1 Tax=Polychaeton citri CBS 116435 TaxID=1314669 RepID=A0A9P4Q3H4_9PEZI|nr:hypothetical protein K431DRAFT_288561 [Polychaeton citri CBS 116435]